MNKYFEGFFNDSKTNFLNPVNNFDPVALCVYPGYITLLLITKFI